MSVIRVVCARVLCFGIFSFAPLLILQSVSAQNAPSVLGQMATAFSAGQVVHNVQLSGSATWNAGSLQDSGTATLTAAADGSSAQMQLILNSSGLKTETQTGAGSSADCQWSGADGVSHEISIGNCWKPAVWFVPAISLQPSLIPSYLGIVDLGTGTVGSTNNTYRHLQSQMLLADLPGTLATDIAQQSTTDLGLDPISFLPAVICYSVFPDSAGPPIPIAIEIRYSNYQTVNGVQIPFLIQKFVNGSLQLAITVSSAQIS